MKFCYTIILLIAFYSMGCKKSNSPCDTTLKLTCTNTAPKIGEPFIISDPADDGFYQWSGPGQTGSNNFNRIESGDAKYSDRGWYHCTKSIPECSLVLHDSIFIDVQLQQEATPCALTANHADCSNVPDPSFSSVIKSYSIAHNALELYASGIFGYPTFTVLFNSYNGASEPLDGVYITTDRQSFNVLDEYNTISVSFLYSSMFFHCNPGKKVYVKHINGKLQVEFCNLNFGNGMYNTIVSANIKQS